MSAHAIISPQHGQYNFEFWRGSPPPLVQQNVVTHTRPGNDGVGQQRLGIWARPAACVVVGHYENFGAADLVFWSLVAVVGSGPCTVIWNTIDYSALYGHFYLVDDVQKVSLKTRPRLTGPGYDFIGGAELVANVTLTAFKP